MPPFCYACGASVNINYEYCHDCLQYIRPWRHGYGVFRFEGTARHIIHRLKYRGTVALTPYLANAAYRKLMQERVNNTYLYIVPVPLFWFREFRRGYNQAALFAHELGCKLKIPDVHLLRRRRWTQMQASLPRIKRIKNLRNAFEINCQKSLPRGPVLLVDDVFTTGSTLEECTITLKKAGFGPIDILTLARG